MKKLIAMACFMLAASSVAFAQDKAKDAAATPVPKAEKAKKEPSEAQRMQQERMKECNIDAGDKKGDDRKKFMSSCLKDRAKSQQERMKSCNKDAGDKKLKGDDRKAFMKDCLSAKKN